MATALVNTRCYLIPIVETLQVDEDNDQAALGDPPRDAIHPFYGYGTHDARERCSWSAATGLWWLQPVL